MTIIWPGTPGESYHNTTGKIVYQLVCSLVNTCGACMQYHLAIAKWWSPFHRGCNCRSTPIYPDKISAPYEDFREIIDSLPPDEQKKVVGSSNKKLIDAGIIDWGDVVTSNRVKLFREVISIKHLTVEDLMGAGIQKWIAEHAWESVNTEAHLIAEQHRRQLLEQVLEMGIQPQHLKDRFGDIMGQRIGLGGNLGGGGTIGPGKGDQEWINILLGSLVVGGLDGGPVKVTKENSPING